MTEQAVFANGCFWCTEAIFRRLRGVSEVLPGYTGGTTNHPTYTEVASGATGHAEALQISFDPSVISYEVLLEIFWHTHNPTTLNRQGSDVGTQYRSAIFYQNDAQQKQAQQTKAALEKSGTYSDPIVTKIVPLAQFFPAENYHQNYYENHRQEGYCTLVIDPKIKKLIQRYTSLIKPEFL